MTPTTNIHEAEQQDAALDGRRTRGEIRAGLEATVVVIGGCTLFALVAYWVTAGVQS